MMPIVVMLLLLLILASVSASLGPQYELRLGEDHGRDVGVHSRNELSIDVSPKHDAFSSVPRERQVLRRSDTATTAFDSEPSGSFPDSADSTAPTGVWIVVNNNATLTRRHEACFVMVGRRAYLIGGRGKHAVDIYDPVTRTWSQGQSPPIELHHMQCVALDDKVWIVSSWTGSFPREKNVKDIYIYTPSTDTWSTRPGLPKGRRRGAAATVVVDRRIYVSHGNRGGHETFLHARTLGWLDYYDVDSNTWTTRLPSAPNPRDHTGGALVLVNSSSRRLLCVAGGRDGGKRKFFNRVILPTDCFDLETNTWSVVANIPQGRAGSSYGTSCDGKLIVAGGEGFGKAFANVDIFDGTTWSSSNIQIARHGSGLAVDCTCQQVYLASGAGTQGGSLELSSVETWFPNGTDVPCLL